MGITTLRPRKNNDKSYQVAASLPGGWGIVADTLCATRDAAEFIIDQIVAQNPTKYRKDNQATEVVVITDAAQAKRVIAEHKANGVETLRAKYSHKQSAWGIVKNTITGGWRTYGNGYNYMTKAQAEETILSLVRRFPTSYRFDNGATEYVKIEKV